MAFVRRFSWAMVVFVAMLFLFQSGSLHEAEMASRLVKRLEMISNVQVVQPSFNPTRGEKAVLIYTLSRNALVSIGVFDPDETLVKTIVDSEKRAAGFNRENWDGRDTDGVVVPDEAYFFTIEANDEEGNYDEYDPTTFSGGEEFDIVVAEVNRLSNTVTYELPCLSRILIRIGVMGGPLLRTLVDWRPRVAGEITEYWNGMDRDDLVNVRDLRGTKMIITGFRLPESSFITHGNAEINYRQYNALVKRKRPGKANRKISRPEGTRVSLHYDLPRWSDYAPEIKLSFPQAQELVEGGVPILRNRALVRVEVSERDSAVVTHEPFEISFFLDMVYYAEEEVGRSPYDWTWDLSNVSEGEHIVTVNMATFRDQIGVVSRRIIVKRD